MTDPSEHHDPYRLARRDMIARQIEARGVQDPRVLAAIESVPRERFVPDDARAVAYADQALAIDEQQTISQPFMVAYMTQALRVGPRDKVLEVGTGSGYQTAILARLTDRLFSIERLAGLAQSATRRLADLGIADVRFRVGDGSLGWPEQAPFDRILVTAAAPEIPPPLVDQLVDGGRLVVPVGGGTQQTVVSVLKLPGRTIERTLIACEA